jgi:hypothetical protein
MAKLSDNEVFEAIKDGQTNFHKGLRLVMEEVSYLRERYDEAEKARMASSNLPSNGFLTEELSEDTMESIKSAYHLGGIAAVYQLGRWNSVPKAD